MASDATPQAIGEHDDLKPIHAGVALRGDF